MLEKVLKDKNYLDGFCEVFVVWIWVLEFGALMLV